MLPQTELWAGSNRSKGAGKKFCVPSSPGLAQWWQGPALPPPASLLPVCPGLSGAKGSSVLRAGYHAEQEGSAEGARREKGKYPSPLLRHILCPLSPQHSTAMPQCLGTTAAFSLRVPSLFSSPTSNPTPNHTPPGSPSSSRLPIP